MSQALSPLLESLRDFPAATTAEATATAAASASASAAVSAAASNEAGAQARQREALDRALHNGLPTQRAERWKYTSLRALSARRFVATAATPSLHPALLADIPMPRMVFVNGRFDAALSDLRDLPEGLAWSRQADAAQDTPTAGDSANASGRDSFDDLNAGLSRDGAILKVADGIHVQEPVHLVFVGAPAERDIAFHLRHRIDLGDGARLAVVEHHLAGGAHRHFANQHVALRLGVGAKLVHARIQDEDAGATLVERTHALLDADAALRRIDLELGAGLCRHDLTVSLLGAGSSVESGGALLASGRRHLDTQLDVRHVARDTRSDLLWRGLAADRGRLAFHGGIHIFAGADGSEAALSNKNLLLSDQAEVDTQPVLQIDADEVKAAHGATVGQLDPTALFYLRSRGLPYTEARTLLTLAFCREALSVIADADLVALLSPRLEARLLEVGEFAA
ncbi:Fe-S cluster assembly protein SufD [soil metagenome]